MKEFKEKAMVAEATDPALTEFDMPKLVTDDTDSTLTPPLTDSDSKIISSNTEDYRDHCFLLLYHECSQFSASQWQDFLPAAYTYLIDRLPKRDVLYVTYCQNAYTEDVEFQKARLLLRQYERLANSLLQNLGYVAWREFCQHIRDVLYQKGFYRPESWLIGVGASKKNPRKNKTISLPSAIEFTQHCELYPSIQNYYCTLLKRLCALMGAQWAIFSGRIASEKTKAETMVTLMTAIVTGLSSMVPVLGGAVSTSIQFGQKVFEISSNVKKRRLGAFAVEWTLTPDEVTPLAIALALRLTLLREHELVHQESSSSLGALDYAAAIYQGVMDAKSLKDIQILAEKDATNLLELLQTLLPPQILPEQDATSRLQDNADFLLIYFKDKHIPESLSSLRLQLDDSKPEIMTMPSLPAAVFYEQGSLEKKESDKISLFERLEIIREQALYSHKIQYQAGWNQSFLTVDTTELSVLLDFQNHILDTLSQSLNWTEKERNQVVEKYMSPLWVKGATLAVFTQTPSVSWLSWQTNHPRIEYFLSTVQQQGKVGAKLARNIRVDYQRALQLWHSQLQMMQNTHQHELAKQHSRLAALNKRYQAWLTSFQSKYAELKIDPTILAIPSSPIQPNPAVEYASPGAFRRQVWDLWYSQKDFDAFEEYSLRFENAWKSSCNQTRPTVGDLFDALAYSLCAAQEALEEVYHNESKTITEQCAVESKKQQTIKSQADTLVEAYQKLALQASEPSSIFLLTPDSASLSSTTLLMSSDISKHPHQGKKQEIKEKKQEYLGSDKLFWETFKDIIAKEQKGVTLPCEFSILAWPRDCSGQITGQWCWGILLTDETQVSAPYWSLFIEMLNAQLVDLMALAPHMNWMPQMQDGSRQSSISTYMLTAKDLTPYRHSALCVSISETNREQAAEKLFPMYKEAVEQQLKTSIKKLISGKEIPVFVERQTIGFTYLEKTFTSLPPARLKEYCLPYQEILNPILLWCRDIATYYGFAPEAPEILFNLLLKEKYLHPAFIEDIRAAYLWTLKHCQTLQKAWQTQKSPKDLKLGQAILLAKDATIPKGELAVFYISQDEYQHHYTYSVLLLKENYTQWKPIETCPKEFDPLSEFVQHELKALVSDRLTYKQSTERLDILTQALLHRPYLQQASWHARLFVQLPSCRQIYYVEQLSRYFSEQTLNDPAGFVYHLRHEPSFSGRRVRWLQEQKEWHEHLLPKLWRDNGSMGTPQLTRSYRTLRNGLWVWKTETHFLKPEIAKQLFQTNNQWLPKDDQRSGNHRVFPVTIDEKVQFWVKVYPEQPAMEWLVTELGRRLGVFGTPRIELVKFHHGDFTSAALISEHVPGKSLRDVIKNEPELLGNIHFPSFLLALLQTLLINPEDDKDDDYFLVKLGESYKLMRIDNERVFFSPETKKRKLFSWQPQYTLQVKSILFCLEQMREKWPTTLAMQSVVDDWQQFDAVALMQDVLQAAEQQRLAWRQLFSFAEIRTHFERMNPEKSLLLMFIPSGLTLEIINRLTHMQAILRSLINKLVKTDASLERKIQISDAEEKIKSLDEHDHEEKKYQSTYHFTGLDLLQEVQPKLASYYSKAHQIILSEEDKKSEISSRSIDHRQVNQRFIKYVVPYYSQDKQGRIMSSVPSSEAIQTSLRLETSLSFEQLQHIYRMESHSPKQELQLLIPCHETQLKILIEQMLEESKSAAIIRLKQLPQNYGQTFSAREEKWLWETHRKQLMKDFCNLPLVHRERLWRQHIRHKLEVKALTLEQQQFLLEAMTKTYWRKLDFSLFAPEMINRAHLVNVLKNCQELALVELNISNCIELTSDILQIVHRYCPQLQCLRMNNQTHWKQIYIGDFSKLMIIECNYAKELVRINLGCLPALKCFAIEGATALQGIANNTWKTAAWVPHDFKKFEQLKMKQLKSSLPVLEEDEKKRKIKKDTSQQQVSKLGFFSRISKTTRISDIKQDVFTAKATKIVADSRKPSKILNIVVHGVAMRYEMIDYMGYCQHNIYRPYTLIGLDFFKRKFLIDEVEMKLAVFVMGTNRGFTEVNQGYSKSAYLNMIMLSVNNEYVQDRFEVNVRELVRNITAENEKSPIIVVGVDTHLRQEEESSCISYEDAFDLVNELGFEYYEYSYQEGINKLQNIVLINGIKAALQLREDCKIILKDGYVEEEDKDLKRTNPPCLGNSDVEETLAKLLESQLSAVNLNLKGHINSEGVQALARIIRSNNPKLTSISFGWHYINNDDADALIEALAENYTLTYLKIDSNYLSRSKLLAIKKPLQRNQDLFERLLKAIAYNKRSQIIALQTKGVCIEQSIAWQGEWKIGCTALITAVLFCQPTMVDQLLVGSMNLLTATMEFGSSRLFYLLQFRCALEIAIELAIEKKEEILGYQNIIKKLIRAYQQQGLKLPKIAEDWLRDPENESHLETKLSIPMAPRFSTSSSIIRLTTETVTLPSTISMLIGTSEIDKKPDTTSTTAASSISQSLPTKLSQIETKSSVSTTSIEDDPTGIVDKSMEKHKQFDLGKDKLSKEFNKPISPTNLFASSQKTLPNNTDTLVSVSATRGVNYSLTGTL